MSLVAELVAKKFYAEEGLKEILIESLHQE
jgi:hypothetical protein